MKYKFSQIVNIKKATKCAICESYTYVLSQPIEPSFVEFIKPIGALKYPIEHTQIIKIDNENVQLQARLYRAFFDIKYKKEPAVYKRLFDTLLASYLSQTQDIEIDMI